MSNEPILLFLHGVGTGDRDDKWKATLTETLVDLQYPDLERLRVIAPKYGHILAGWDEKKPLPGVTIRQLSRELAKKNRRDFEHRMAAIEFRLGYQERGNGYIGGDAVISAAVASPFFKQARNYLKDPQIRSHVLDLILEKLPNSGKVVIVGHSLGSVIAADLITRLPQGLDVVGMVTIGSPLANGSFVVDDLRKTLNDPPTNLAWWVNFWNSPDLVAAHRGVSSVFPWMFDFRINTKSLPKKAHAAVEYLANETVAEAIGFALFGSRTKDLDRIDAGHDIALDTAEQLALLGLRYAHLIKARLEGELQERYSGALRRVQAATIDSIQARSRDEKRPMPRGIARLAFDFADPDAVVPAPLPGSHIPKEQAVLFLTAIAAENVIRPFEISIPKDKKSDKRLDAMKELTAEMGLGSHFGVDVFVSAELAHEALNGGTGVNWIRWGALGVGAAAIVATPVGLIMAAGAGLAGAAAIASALAAFGQGGMIGGLLTAGTLVGAGGGGIALGLAGSGTSAETLEAVVARQLTAEILRNRQGLEPDPAVWKNLVEIENEVQRQHERLDEYSDDSAPSVKELKRKLEAIKRALKYLTDNDLEPGVEANTPEKTGWKIPEVLALGVK